jgi:predicted phosphodiesterase
MRLLILSDLHVEHAPFERPQAQFDVVVLAGDIHNGPQAIQWARETFPHWPIIQVAGNHEFFGAQRDACLDHMRQSAHRLNVHFLENDAVEIDGVHFFGATLWTDYRVFERPGRPFQIPAQQAMQANLNMIADYWKIEESPGQWFMPSDAVRLHGESRAWLEERLHAPRTGLRVVVSHHLPSWSSVAPAFEGSVTNAGFVSDLDDLVAQSDLWIHGHTHTSHHYQVGHAEVVSNPRGYPWRGGPSAFENPQFNANRVIQI